MTRLPILAACGMLIVGAAATGGTPATAASFEVHEKSILELQAAQAGQVSARGLVESYVARIEAYDRAGPWLSSIVAINPRALEDADELNQERMQWGPRGPLHGIPILVKDNFEVSGMMTGGGSIAQAKLQASQDAFQVERLLRPAPSSSARRRCTTQYREVPVLRSRLRSAVLDAFQAHRLDVLAYSGISRKPARIGTSQPGRGAGLPAQSRNGPAAVGCSRGLRRRWIARWHGVAWAGFIGARATCVGVRLGTVAPAEKISNEYAAIGKCAR